MKIVEYPIKTAWAEILKRPELKNSDLDYLISSIVDAVQKDGDAAIQQFTKQFDGIEISNLLVTSEEFSEAEKNVSEDLKAAIEKARINIEKFHVSQREEIKKIETTAGVTCWRKSIPISRVGLYIPGGTAPLFSTILMLGVPANIAGCEEIVLCTPPDKAGKIHPAILYTAKSLGIKKVYKCGGAQAIAGMAFGTQSISKVYKIFGPGNQFVTAAKQMVTKFGVAIDMPAGPSEVAVLADATANPDFVAADLLSQAEHGKDSQVLLVSDSLSTIEAVNKALDEQVKRLPREFFAESSLTHSKAILVRNLEEGMDLINAYAPEHLILQVQDFEKYALKVINAGSVFMGPYTPESAGDYASGTNHTLPTNGYAMAYSGVSLDSFVRKVTFQHITKEGLKNIGPVIEIMAEAEQLIAHKRAVSIRLEK